MTTPIVKIRNPLAALNVALAGLAAVAALASAAWAQTPGRPVGSAVQFDWSVLLKARNDSTGLSHASTRLGEMAAVSAAGYNANDLPAPAPSSTPYLYISFPHPEWGANAGAYATDFRPVSATQAQSWTFQLNANPPGGVATLSWEGDARILAGSTLTDVANKKTINVSDPAHAAGVTVNVRSAAQTYVWTYTPPSLPTNIR